MQGFVKPALFQIYPGGGVETTSSGTTHFPKWKFHDTLRSRRIIINDPLKVLARLPANVVRIVP
jgi:hypothetical protein